MINVDHTFQDATRAYIRHISVKNRANFAEVLQQAVEFGWTKMLADHIRVDLLHVKDETTDKLAADVEIKTALAMNRKGFKWKTLINDPDTGKRFQIMQLNKPADLAVDADSVAKARKMKPKQQPLSIKAGMILRVSKEASRDTTEPTGEED